MATAERTVKMEEEQEVRAPTIDPRQNLLQDGEHQEVLPEEPLGQYRLEETVVSTTSPSSCPDVLCVCWKLW